MFRGGYLVLIGAMGLPLVAVARGYAAENPPSNAKLIELLRSADDKVREQAAEMLASRGDEAATELVKLLSDKDENLKKGIKRVFVGMKARGVPHLLRVLSGQDAAASTRAVDLLGALKKDGKDAVPTLIQTASRDAISSDLRLSAIRALGQIHDTHAV